MASLRPRAAVRRGNLAGCGRYVRRLEPGDGRGVAPGGRRRGGCGGRGGRGRPGGAARWAALPHDQRAKVLIDALGALGDLQDTLVEALVDEGGSWIGKAMFETGYVAGIAQAAAAAAHMVTGELLPSDDGKVSMVACEPVGVVSVVSPWNFPLLLSMRAVAFALAIGNAVVLKPSEETPVAGGLLVGPGLRGGGPTARRPQCRHLLAPRGWTRWVRCSWGTRRSARSASPGRRRSAGRSRRSGVGTSRRWRSSWAATTR